MAGRRASGAIWAWKPGGQGLVHITQIRDGFVESVEDELSQGQEVEVRIENLDVDAGKMGDLVAKKELKSPSTGMHRRLLVTPRLVDEAA